MTFYSYNINGLKSCIDKGFLEYFLSTNADFFCLQEIKTQIPLSDIPGYFQFWNLSSRKGYSGTAIITKHNTLTNENEFINDERIELEYLLNSNFIDSFRYLYPYEKDCYTWWNVGKDSKVNNIGWRLDYFLVSDYLQTYIFDSIICKDINCSDHCPIQLTMNFSKEDL